MAALGLLDISDDELETAIRSDADVQAQLAAFARDTMLPVARSNSPVDTGAYAAGWEVETGDGVVRLVNTNWKTYIVELGTVPDAHGGVRYIPSIGVKVGEDTPTPAFAPGEKTATQFGGHIDPIKSRQ